MENETSNKQEPANSNLDAVISWVAYDWNNKQSRPPKYGRYLIYRKKCKKMHFENWNGNGWDSSNGDCTHWCEVFPPCL